MRATTEDEAGDVRGLALKIATTRCVYRSQLASRGDPDIGIGDIVRDAETYVKFLRGFGSDNRAAALMAANQTAGARLDAADVVDRAETFLKFLRGAG